MKGMIRAAAMAFLLASGVSWAEDYDAGLEAFNAGDYETAYETWRPMAEQGDAVAQNRLGIMYAKGRAVVQHYAEALRWYRAAAEQGHAEAQHNLGLMYEDDLGVAQDYAEAARWYRAAAEQGFASAQNNLGDMYLQGRGVAQDDAEAVRWYQAASAQAQRNNRICRETGYQDCGACIETNYQDCDWATGYDEILPRHWLETR